MSIFARIFAITAFFIWRVENNISDVNWLWAISVAGDVWFGFSWLFNQLSRLNPMKSIPDLVALKKQYDLLDGGSTHPAIDIFINTANLLKRGVPPNIRLIVLHSPGTYL
jgi:mixed-linked glucan synthase